MHIYFAYNKVRNLSPSSLAAGGECREAHSPSSVPRQRALSGRETPPQPSQVPSRLAVHTQVSKKHFLEASSPVRLGRTFQRAEMPSTQAVGGGHQPDVATKPRKCGRCPSTRSANLPYAPQPQSCGRLRGQHRSPRPAAGEDPPRFLLLAPHPRQTDLGGSRTARQQEDPTSHLLRKTRRNSHPSGHKRLGREDPQTLQHTPGSSKQP